MASLYKTRWENAMTGNDTKLSFEELEHWGESIKLLEKSAHNIVYLNLIYSDKKTYLLFWSEKLDELICCLWFYSKKTLNELEENARSSVKGKRYFKGASF